LQKVASFVKVAIDETEGQRLALFQFQKKEAALKQKQTEEEKAKDESLKQYSRSLDKAADALYKTDFITDEFERREFVKRAQQNPSYLASVVEKLCKAADVALIGSPARVAVKRAEDEIDPVRARAFGLSTSSSVIFDE
jgi:hypothetical protein